MCFYAIIYEYIIIERVINLTLMNTSTRRGGEGRGRGGFWNCALIIINFIIGTGTQKVPGYTDFCVPVWYGVEWRQGELFGPSGALEWRPTVALCGNPAFETLYVNLL